MRVAAPKSARARQFQPPVRRVAVCPDNGSSRCGENEGKPKKSPRLSSLQGSTVTLDLVGRDWGRNSVAHACQGPVERHSLSICRCRNDELERLANDVATFAIDAFDKTQIARTFKSPC